MGGDRTVPRPGWNQTIRQRAVDLSDAERLTGQEIRQRLKSELGADVPLPTVRRWVREGVEPMRAPTAEELAERVQILVSSELRRLERQSRPDLERLSKCAQILKTVNGVKQAPKQKARTLADLSSQSDRAEEEAVQLAA
jgi:hypothetical protein